MLPARLLLSLVRLLLLALAASKTAAWTTTHTPVRPLRQASVARRTATRMMARPADDGDGNYPVIHEPATLNKRAEDYSILASKVVALDKGWVITGDGDAGARVVVKRNVRDIDRDRSRSFLLQFQHGASGPGTAPRWVQGATLPFELTGASAVSISPSGKHTLVFKEEEAGAAGANGGEKKVLAEVWSATALLKTLQLGHAHGPVMGDAWFGAFTWSEDEETVGYVAQLKPQGKRLSAFDAGGTAACKAGQDEDGKEKKDGEDDSKFEYREDWGEKFEATKEGLGLFLLSLRTGRVARVPGIPSTITPGGPLLSKDGSNLVFIGWDDEPRRLGMIYCYQRPCRLYAAHVQQLVTTINQADTLPAPPNPLPSPQCLTPMERLARSPAFSRDGTKLAYLGSTDGFDTHNGPMALRVLDWAAFANGTPPASLPLATLVAEVATPPAVKPDQRVLGSSLMGFPGLWTDCLARDCWAPDDSAIYLTSTWGSSNALLRIALEVSPNSTTPTGVGGLTGRVEPLVKAAEAAGVGFGGLPAGEIQDASASLLAVSPLGLLVAGSACNSPGGFGMLSLDGSVFYPAPPLEPAAVSSTVCRPERYAQVSAGLEQVRWRVLTLQPTDSRSDPFGAILMLPPPSSSSKGGAGTGKPPRPPPLVVVPHGGPHSCTTTNFFHAYAFLCVSYGYAVLHVNYRGSTGFGTDALASLAGHVGQNDVDDVFVAAHAARVLRQDPSAQYTLVDPERIAIVGGSHGGFLGAHAIAKYPEMFKVAALRNPVTNIATMTTATDIPDWASVEAGVTYDFGTFAPPSAEQLARMWATSPIAGIDRVRAPTLIALGKRDRRVPFSQGLEFYHALKARGVPTKLLMYEQDVHAIDRPVSEADHWLQIAGWLEAHL